MGGGVNPWQLSEHVRDYLARADSIPHRTEGESTLLEVVSPKIARFLDLGCGDGRLLGLVKMHAPDARAVGLDFSPAMLEEVRGRFGADPLVRIVEHDLSEPLPGLGEFDAVVSSFAIHHLTHERKRALYAEVFAMLRDGGVFCNLEHVSSPTELLHAAFYAAIGVPVEKEDPSNRLLGLETQLEWLREIGFRDVDCLWKWRELALMTGRKAA
jgi:cyclopropane fatty-acyl-phospholipid synthase-like methyltransferase